MKDDKVKAIINGTVIDHIPHGKSELLVKIFYLSANYTYLVGSGLKSDKVLSGKKDIIKIEDRELSQEETNILSLLAPGVTVSIIRDKEVCDKVKIQLPKTILNLIICNNSKCITSIDKETETEFIVIQRQDGVFLQCKYCEKEYPIEELQINL
ncbi:MAG: aspartate carbamoyltransferase regulatory subunit [Patescibacteria group bacterium]|nr:aspartate carbamoyltransferase regulatory subunit [Patescibacteria group bacterium]